jgi:hypothetical protein
MGYFALDNFLRSSSIKFVWGKITRLVDSPNSLYYEVEQDSNSLFAVTNNSELHKIFNILEMDENICDLEFIINFLLRFEIVI